MTINGICSLNLTLIGLNYMFNDFLIIEPKERKIKGFFEKAWSYLLGRDKNCRLVVADTIELSDNKSVKSAFGSFIDKTADAFLVLQPLNVDSDVGEYSHAVSHETYPAIHPIKHFEKVDANFDILDFIADFNQSYFVLYFACIAANFVVLSYLLSAKAGRRLKMFNFQLFKNLLVHYFFGFKVTNRILSVGILLLSTRYLTEITKNLITNSMRTSSVIVETSELISTIKDVESSSRWICWIEEDEIWVNAKGSRAYEIIKSKDTSGCSFPVDSDERTEVALSKFHEHGIVVTDRCTSYFFASTFAKLFPGQRYWLSNPILETVHSHYLRRSLPQELKLELNKLSMFTIEFGIDLKAKELAVQSTSRMSNVPQESFLFQSLERFIQANIKLVFLEISAFRTLFLLVLVIDSVVILLALFFGIKRSTRSSRRAKRRDCFAQIKFKRSEIEDPVRNKPEDIRDSKDTDHQRC